MTYKFDCRFFDGYKPCRYKRSCVECPEYSQIGEKIVILSLEALGAVLRSSCLLLPIKRRFPNSQITWVTLPNAAALLQNNSLIDRVITVSQKNMALLNFLSYDYLYAVDKSPSAGALAEMMQAKTKFGFGLTQSGAIRPFTDDAAYQFAVGLDDDLKFYKNQKTETEQITNSMGYFWQRDPYVLELTKEEKRSSLAFRQKTIAAAHGLLGFNTGCSVEYPYKKFTTRRSIETIALWRRKFPSWKVVLLGGKEDRLRQEEMKEAFSGDPFVVNAPTDQGLRSGLVFMSATDIVFTGCSLGLHMAVALKKYTICWFGVSCAQEIDLYDRGEKIEADVPCSPCWKKSCQQTKKCFDYVSLEKIEAASGRAIDRIQKREK